MSWLCMMTDFTYYYVRSSQCQLYFFGGLKGLRILSCHPKSIPDYTMMSDSILRKTWPFVFLQDAHELCGYKAGSLAVQRYHAKFFGTPLRSMRGYICDALSLL